MQDIEKRIREALGWPVQKSVMKNYKMTVPTEWIIIPPTQSKHLHNKLFQLRRSSEIHMIDTRLLDNIPKLSDQEKRDTFQWMNGETKQHITFQPFQQNIQENRSDTNIDMEINNPSIFSDLSISSSPLLRKSGEKVSSTDLKNGELSSKTSRNRQEKTSSSKK